MYAKLDTVGDFIVTPYEIVGDPYVQYATYPRIAVDYRNRLHVIWTDTRSGVAEDIYYKYTTGEIGIKDESRKKTTRLSLLKIYPNPFRNTIRIAAGENLKLGSQFLNIYDITGRLVKRFDLRSNSSGQLLEFYWDGKDDEDNSLPSGIYFVQVKSRGGMFTKKIIKLE
jgi:hypothetical protein